VAELTLALDYLHSVGIIYRCALFYIVSALSTGGHCFIIVLTAVKFYKLSKFYVAELALALHYLHSVGIIYRWALFYIVSAISTDGHCST
jgi:serine/threonine protein kinase